MKAERNLLFVAAFAVLVMCGAAWAVDSNGLIAHWKFDEGSGPIAYDSAGDNDGTIYGAQWTTGKVGDALEFDGDGDYVDISDDASLRFSQYDSFTICFWALPTGNGGNIFGKYRAPFQHGVFGYNSRWVGSISAFRLTVEKSYIGWTDITTPEDSAAAGSWYHVTCVYESKDVKIYLNGEISASGTFGYDTGSTTPDENATIGARAYDSTIDQYFDGLVDDVRIYDRALSAEEVQELYQGGSGPIAHWKFDEGSGPIAYDSAGDNDGTIYGAQWTTGQVGDALEFDGDGDYVDIGRPESLTNMGSGTIALWFKPTSTLHTGSYGTYGFFERNVTGTSAPGDTVLGMWPGSGYEAKVTFVIANDTGIHGGIIGSDNNYWPAGVWQHAVGTWDNVTGEIRMFINGVEQADKIDTFTGVTMGADRDVVIGSDSEKNCCWWDGAIDEVAVWDRALSAEEVQELYQGGLPIMIDVDIKPGSCPNPLNLASRGVLPVAILGSQDFDVTTIDVAPTRLAGAAPVRSSYEDVAAPVLEGNECEYTTEGPDGYTDLTLKFKTQQIVNSLGEPGDGETLALTLTGVLTDGISIEGTDCIVVVGKVPRPLVAKRADINEDGLVNILDFSMIAEYWLEPAVVEY